MLKVPCIKGVKIVWESDYRKNPVQIVNDCFEYLIL
jgi:hypothetical protein